MEYQYGVRRVVCRCVAVFLFQFGSVYKKYIVKLERDESSERPRCAARMPPMRPMCIAALRGTSGLVARFTKS